MPMRDDVIYRPLRADDADAVLEVLRENYLGDYFNARCYDKAHILEANASGEQVLYVAALQSGEFVGVVGAKRAKLFPGSYELSFHILRKAFQGQGLAKGLLAYCIRECEERLMADTYGHCVTYHVITQNEMAQLGMHTVGMWLGRHRSRRAYLETYHFEPRTSKLHSLVITKRGPTKDAGVLYPPAGQEAFVARAYAQLGAACHIEKAGGAAAGETDLTVRTDAEAANTDLYFIRLGGDALQKLDEAAAAPRDALQTYTALINMADPGCPDFCRALEARGFFFSGVHPLHAGREYALYHLPCAEIYDFDELKLTDENRAFAAQVRAQYERRVLVP